MLLIFNVSFFLFLSPPLYLFLHSLSFQVRNKYTAHDFDDDSCTVLRRAGCHDKKIVFIMFSAFLPSPLSSQVVGPFLTVTIPE